jgi:LysR family transcriptional regulator, hydrogen peroxide-inducible genes activator
MTITQLEYIIAVDTHRHFAIAAEYCFVTQPTLSMQIQKLEDTLDCKIFDRSKQPVIPTETGEAIITQARIIVHETKMLLQLINQKKGLIEGELRIGIIPTIAPYLLPLFLQNFLAKYPQVKLKITELTTDVIVEKLKAGKIDAGILVTPLLDSSIIEYHLLHEELVAYISKSNAAYKKRYVLPTDIDLKQLWLLEEGHCFRNQIINLCELKKQQIEQSHVEYQAGSLETLRKLVEVNNGITILPEMSTTDFNTKQKNMVRHFKQPVPVREISLVTHRSYHKKKLIDALKIEIVQALPIKKIATKKTITVSIS